MRNIYNFQKVETIPLRHKLPGMTFILSTNIDSWPATSLPSRRWTQPPPRTWKCNQGLVPLPGPPRRWQPEAPAPGHLPPGNGSPGFWAGAGVQAPDPTSLRPDWRRCRPGRRRFPSRCGRIRWRSGGRETGVGARKGSMGEGGQRGQRVGERGEGCLSHAPSTGAVGAPNLCHLRLHWLPGVSPPD